MGCSRRIREGHGKTCSAYRAKQRFSQREYGAVGRHRCDNAWRQTAAEVAYRKRLVTGHRLSR